MKGLFFMKQSLVLCMLCSSLSMASKEFGKAPFSPLDPEFYNYVPREGQFYPYLGWGNFEKYRQGYQDNWDRMYIHDNKVSTVNWHVDKIMKGETRYRGVSKAAGIPWWTLGIIHMLEAGASFNHHQHNGNPLSGRTYEVPAGRPKTGNPPFTWEESAIDATRYDGLHEVKEWTIPHIAFVMESFNGFGYRQYNNPSPYLWSFSNIWKKGKYVKDGKYDPNAGSDQAGGLVILKRFFDRKILKLDSNKQVVDYEYIKPNPYPINSEDFYCPEPSKIETINGKFECIDRDNSSIYNFLTPEAVELCKLYRDDECDGQVFDMEYNDYLKDGKVCHKGASLNKEYNLCIGDSGEDIYGPFPKTAVEKCYNDIKDDTCYSLRWSVSYFKHLIK